MLPLDDIRWAKLQHAYGAAADTPRLLRQAEDLPDYGEGNTEPYFSLWSSLCHQGDVYAASYAAVPHLVALIEANTDRFRWTLLSLVQAIEAARLTGKGPEVPDYLSEGYQCAIKRIPLIAVTLLSTRVTELECRVILSACAVSAGHPVLSEAICELDPQNIKQLYSCIFGEQ